MVRHPYITACAVAAVTGLLAVVGALTLDLPFRDPDGFIGPAYVRLPVIVMFFLLLDILPLWVREARATGQVVSTFRRLVEERWSLTRLALVVAGLAAFYVTYVGYRNLKGYLPFVREELVDGPLHALDRTLLLGREPGPWLHDLLGTGISAQILSVVYISYLLFVPMSLAAALVWSRDMSRGFWYVTALCLNWTLGIVSYYMLPSLGPAFAYSYLYEDLPQTAVADLQDGLLNNRLNILANPEVSNSIQGIAGFASLHVSVVFTAALFCYRAGTSKNLQRALWAYLALTVLSTIYFGWHYILDDIAGFGIGWLAVAAGQRVTRREVVEERVVDRDAPEIVPTPAVASESRAHSPLPMAVDDAPVVADPPLTAPGAAPQP